MCVCTFKVQNVLAFAPWAMRFDVVFYLDHQHHASWRRMNVYVK